MRLLITGGAGFIGHHLVKRLLPQEEHEIIIIDDLSNAKNSFVDIIANSSQNKNVSFYKEDIRNKDIIFDIFKRERTIDTCIHLAAKVNVFDSLKNPADTVNTNIIGTLNLLEAMSSNNVKNFVFASSAAVYGEPKKLPSSEDDVLEPLSPYGASKVGGEALVSSFASSGKIRNSISLRIFNAYGACQNPSYAGVITRFAERLGRMLPPIIYGNGEQTRDFISINDIVSTILLAAQEQKVLHPNTTKVFNVGTGKAIKIKDLAKMMIKILDLDLEPIFAESKRGDVVNSYADITKLKTNLRFSPSEKIEFGLKQILKPSTIS